VAGGKGRGEEKKIKGEKEGEGGEFGYWGNSTMVVGGIDTPE